MADFSQSQLFWWNTGASWMGALQDCADTGFEYWRDCLDARTPEDFLDVQAFYANKQMKTFVKLMSAPAAIDRDAGGLQ